MRTERFRCILLSTLLVTSLMVPLSILALTPAAEALSKAPDLFISEYIEGGYSNKALEIANYTCSPVDLSDYQLELYSNGSPTVSQSVVLSGILNSGDVYVICHALADPTLLAIADNTNSAVCNWNGNDGIVLREIINGSVVDAIGQHGVDPGTEWPGGGKDDTLVRKDTLLQGDTNFNDAFTFATEWDTYSKDNFDFIGWHYAKGTWFEKCCMPDLGQHCVNWCWTAAAANSIYWWSQNGYPELIDDPATADPDNKYITDPLRLCPACPSGGYYRLLDEIAWDCGHEYCEPILDNEYFYGLQQFIDDQGAPLIVHEIVDPDNVWSPPPPGARVIYRPPTLEDYQRELERCQDVLLWLDFNHYEPYEETDHVVTGVGFSYDNTWILVSDPWTPGVPDHNNLLDLKLYDNLLVINSDPLWVLYAGMPVQVSKLVYISPFEPECGVEVTIEPKHKRGTPGTWLNFVMTVHNTGNVPDNYFLSVVPDGWPDIYLDDGPFLNVQPCETRYMDLYVHIPENAVPCTHKEIVVVAESEFCGATDNDNALVQVVSKYLHNVEVGYPLEPDNWVCTYWHEIYPNYDYYYYHLSSWEDTNLDLVVSPGDQIDLTDVENENDITWYYVKDVTCTLVLEPEQGIEPVYWWYLEYENGWDNYCWAWGDPLGTQWNEIRPEFCNRYLLVEWYDSEPYDEVLGWCDWVLLEDKVTGEYIELHVVEIATDLVLCEAPPECGVEVTIEPEHKRGTPGDEVSFYVSVHNTGDIQDDYILSIEPNGWPEEYYYLENYRLENVEPCQTVTTILEVFIPENVLPCTHKEIVVWAESEFCGATDNDNALVQVVSKYLHNTWPGDWLEPGNWVNTGWHEIYPTYCLYYDLESWEDTNLDNVVSPGDQIDMEEETGITSYYIKDVTVTLVVENEQYSPENTWWYLELEGGWENYENYDIWYSPENTQWNMIRPYFCSQWRLSYWDDDGNGYLWDDDNVYIELKPFFDIGYWVHVLDVVTDLVLCEIPENWTGSADFSLKNLYTVNVEKILDLNVGSKLVVKFYTYADAYENENVVETFSPPAHVEENELARHPEGVCVKKARLVLTTDNTDNVISTIASYTVRKVDLEIRFSEIPLEWLLALPAERTALEIEFSSIPLCWLLAPS